MPMKFGTMVEGVQNPFVENVNNTIGNIVNNDEVRRGYSMFEKNRKLEMTMLKHHMKNTDYRYYVMAFLDGDGGGSELREYLSFKVAVSFMLETVGKYSMTGKPFYVSMWQRCADGSSSRVCYKESM